MPIIGILCKMSHISQYAIYFGLVIMSHWIVYTKKFVCYVVKGYFTLAECWQDRQRSDM